MKRFVFFAVAFIMTLTFAASALAFDSAIRGQRIYGGNPQLFLNDITRSYPQMTITIYGDTQFNTEANITFRCYAVGSSTATRSHAISFYSSNWYSGQSKTVGYINGGGSALNLDLRASIPNTNSTAYANFYGRINI